MKGFIYTLILKEPVLANSLSGDTNSARSLLFIPGGLVRGALIQNYKDVKQADDLDFQRLFLNGKTRFLHAYPVCNGMRMLPTPLAWKTYKDDPENKRGVANFAKTIVPDPKIKNAPFQFYALQDGIVLKVKHEWQVNVHTQRDAVYGRAKGQGKGTVYRYEALPAGMKLQGAILVETDDDAKKLKDLLKGPILLGKARTAGYGRTEVKIGDNLPPDWREESFSEFPTDRVNEFHVTFLSEGILRDQNGQPTLDPIPALKARLKTEDIETGNIFHRVEIVGGFNRQWGLPLPQNQAIATGSVFVMNSSSGIEGNDLRTLEVEGLGERTAEGFGRVSISVNPRERYELQNGTLTFDVMQTGEMASSEAPVADLMLKRLLRRDLNEKMQGAVIDATKEYKGSVKNSQLSRWRVNLRNAIGSPEKGLEKIRELYKKEDERNTPSWQKMTRARIQIGGTQLRLTEWMNDLLDEPGSVWGMLGITELPTKKVGGRSFTAEDMAVEYSLRLMDAVMASMAKKNVEGEHDGD